MTMSLDEAASTMILRARGFATAMVPEEWVSRGLHPDALYSSILQQAVDVGIACGIAAATNEFHKITRQPRADRRIPTDRRPHHRVL